MSCTPTYPLQGAVRGTALSISDPALCRDISVIVCPRLDSALLDRMGLQCAAPLVPQAKIGSVTTLTGYLHGFHVACSLRAGAEIEWTVLGHFSFPVIALCTLYV